MTDALPIPPERLLAETKWVRALAARLASPADADDLAQATWLQALQSKPGAILGLRPWLSAVLHHAWHRGHRDEHARMRRERAVARRDALPAAADLATRASLHRAVVDAVLSLEEPGRSTVLLRFFDDRKPGEIARLQGVPVECVRTRLRRALATLRARLDDAIGGRERWVSLAAPALLGRVTAGSAAPVAAAGVLLMSLKLKTAAALVCLVLLSIGVVMAWKALDGPPIDVPSRDASADPDLPLLQPGAPGSRQPVAESSPAQETQAAPAPARSSAVVQIHVSDDQGADVPGAAIIASASTSASATTDARGDARLELPGPCIATIRTAAPGFAESTMRSIPMVDGSRHQIDLIPLAPLNVFVKDPDGNPVSGASVELASHLILVGKGFPGFWRHAQQTDDQGTARFDGIPRIEWYLRVHAAGFEDACSQPGHRNDPRAGPADTTVVLKRGAELTVRVVHLVTGTPVASLPLQIDLHPHDGSTSSALPTRVFLVESDQNGIVSLGRPANATVRIEVVAAMIAEQLILTVPPDQATATVRVREPDPMQCRVTREDGSPIDTAVLEYADPPRRIPMVARDGLFTIDGQGVEDAPYFRFLVPDRATHWRRFYRPKAEVTLVAYASFTIKGQVVDTAGREVPGALVRIDAQDTPRTTIGRLERPLISGTTTSDAHGFFTAVAGADAYHLIQVSTPDGTCARHLVASPRADPAQYPAKISVPLTRSASGAVCDVGQIVVPRGSGSLRASVNAVHPGGSEVVATPIGARAEQFPARRAMVRPNGRAELNGLPEGDYDVQVVPRGANFIAGLFGTWGTPVHVDAGGVAEVTITR